MAHLKASRGAIFPALQDSGFSPEEIRRSWQAMRYGAWDVNDLLQSWRKYVQQQGEWQIHEYEGYRPLAVDLTAIGAIATKRMDGQVFQRYSQSNAQRNWFCFDGGSRTPSRSTPAITGKNPAS